MYGMMCYGAYNMLTRPKHDAKALARPAFNERTIYEDTRRYDTLFVPDLTL